MAPPSAGENRGCWKAVSRCGASMRQLHSYQAVTVDPASPDRQLSGPKPGHTAKPSCLESMGLQTPSRRDTLDSLQGQRVEAMPLGHQFSFDSDVDAYKQRKQSRGCCCCSYYCVQLCSVAFFAVSLLVFLLYNYTLAVSVHEVHDTRFTFWNYVVPQLKFIAASRWDTVSLSRWYKELADPAEPFVGLGPGPNTKTFYAYKTVKRLLEGLALQVKLGTMDRANELGMQMLRSDMWPETGRVMFGLDNSDHATVRPLLGDVLDGAEMPRVSCDGSTCWNLAWLRSVWRQRLARTSRLSSNDLPWLATVVLHKVHLNVDLSDAEAMHFTDFQGRMLRVMALPRNFLTESVFGEFPVDEREEYVSAFKEHIPKKWPKVDWTIAPMKLAVLANALLDSIVVHAGPAVSGAMEQLLALLHMRGEPGSTLARPLRVQDEAAMQDLILETLRRYPPVVGVPYWSENEDGISWRHEIPSLQQALQDPSLFPDPLEFRPGRPGLNHVNSSLSIGFADAAIVDGNVSNRDSRACPGKRLSLAILQAFLQEFSKYKWKADDANIKLTSFASSGFSLRKVE